MATVIDIPGSDSIFYDSDGNITAAPDIGSKTYEIFPGIKIVGEKNLYTNKPTGELYGPPAPAKTGMGIVVLLAVAAGAYMVLK
jgi:hypothetical protein